MPHGRQVYVLSFVNMLRNGTGILLPPLPPLPRPFCDPILPAPAGAPPQAAEALSCVPDVAPTVARLRACSSRSRCGVFGAETTVRGTWKLTMFSLPLGIILLTLGR